MTNIAIEHGPVEIVIFPSYKMGGFSIVMLNSQRVSSISVYTHYTCIVQSCNIQSVYGTTINCHRNNVYRFYAIGWIGESDGFYSPENTTRCLVWIKKIKGPDNPTCVALCVRKTRVEEKEGEKRRRRFVACRLHKV